MATEVSKPVPDRDDPDNAPFWVGTDGDRLLVKHCAECERHHWPPRIGCPHCGSGAIAWVEAVPRGKIFSWTVVHRNQTPGFAAEVPYAVLLVELEGLEGVRMIGNLVNGDFATVALGLPMEAVFTPSDDGSVKLVNWQPADAASGD